MKQVVETKGVEINFAKSNQNEVSCPYEALLTRRQLSADVEKWLSEFWLCDLDVSSCFVKMCRISIEIPCRLPFSTDFGTFYREQQHIKRSSVMKTFFEPNATGRYCQICVAFQRSSHQQLYNSRQNRKSCFIVDIEAIVNTSTKDLVWIDTDSSIMRNGVGILHVPQTDLVSTILSLILGFWPNKRLFLCLW